MIRINMGSNGQLGNRMFRYMYLRSLQRLLPESTVGGYDIPEFNLSVPAYSLEGRILKIDSGHQHSMCSIAHKLEQGVYDAMHFDAYVQRLEYYDNRDLCSSYFQPTGIVVDKEHLGPGKLTIHIRGGDTLRPNVHADYHPVPVSYFEHLANSQQLDPVIVGQIGDDWYSEEIRRRFAGCVFLKKGSAINDFEVIRNSTNIALSVSSFSWIAAWLSKTAKKIFVPVFGYFNPLQRRDVDLLPIRDERYSFWDFPVVRWEASQEQIDSVLAPSDSYQEIPPTVLRSRIA